MTPRARALLLSISRCSLVEKQFEDPTFRQNCSGLITAQAPLERATHQVPEPWSGRLEEAPLLFFGSNPSIDPVEVFPAEAWSDDDVVDFFHNRFGGGRREWVKNLCVLRNDGTHAPSTKWVRFWAACRGRSTELLGYQAKDGIDYAIAEAVHCKSKGERVVKEAVTSAAASTCADRYIRSIVELSPASAIVSFGGIADAELRRIFELGTGRYQQSNNRHFIFLDHPAGFGKFKKISTVLNSGQLASVRLAIKTARSSL